MGAGLEVVDKIDQVIVPLKNGMASQLCSTLVFDESRRRSGSARSCQALDSHLLVGGDVFSKKDHSKGTMIKGCDRLEAAIEQMACLESILHALHNRKVEAPNGGNIA